MIVKTMVSVLALCSLASIATATEFFVSPNGDDTNPGTTQRPFQTLARAQQAVRKVDRTESDDVVVNLAAGCYRLAKPFRLTEEDSGSNTCRVVYRSQDGPGKARLLGSVPLVGWQEHHDGIWKIDLPEGMLFHTLFENGQRAHKARFPNYEHQPDFPTARGRYLVAEDGTPKRYNKKGEKPPQGPGWLTYPVEDAPPAPLGSKTKLLIYTGGKCDWFRNVYNVKSIDPETRKLVFEANALPFGVGAGARFFLEDDLAFLDAPGEFHVDESSNTLYYKPIGSGHPDTLCVAAPVMTRLIEIQGKSRERCVENIRIEGLALEETDGFPTPWWGTHYGRKDGALIWMSNTQGIEVRQCHLNNGGRNGIMLIGHNLDNLVTRCWIEHMGVNGVTLCNRFSSSDEKKATADRCLGNRIHNCRIHNIGEIHTYASCVNLFNVENNDIGHCELHDSVRYAVTLRGNTGDQYGPPVSTNHPPCKNNRMHHLRVYRCGQDGGDMGALHCANLNNPGGGCVNTFEQITVVDCRAVPLMKDYAPDGIFLDWPKMSMDQVFRNIHIVRCQGRQIRSNRPENADSALTENVSWKDGFREELMDRENIGLTDGFPVDYGGKSSVPTK